MKTLIALTLIFAANLAQAETFHCLHSPTGEGEWQIVQLLGHGKAMYQGQTYGVVTRGPVRVNHSGKQMFLLKLGRSGAWDIPFVCYP